MGTRRWRRGATVLLAAAVAGLLTAPGAAATAWTVVPTPNPGTSNTLGGLVRFGTGDVWAVGQASSPSYAGCHGRTLTLRYNGSAFVEVPDTHTAICATVDGVGGTGPSDIWAVGSAGNGRDTHLRHWDGSGWTVVSGATITPPPPGRAQRSTGLNAVAARTPSDVWAVGRAEYADFSRSALIEHFDGAAWSLKAAAGGTGSVLDGVVALAANEAWAVGRAAGGSGTVTLVERWNGSAWTAVPSPNASVQNALHGVAGTSGDLWAVGEATKSFTDGVSTTRTLIEHWDGTAWTRVPSPNVGAGNNALSGVVARGAADVWAVGYDDDVTGDIPVRKTLTLHWNGSRWSVVASPNAGSGDNWLSDAVSASGTAGQVFASGNSAAGTLVERFG